MALLRRVDAGQDPVADRAEERQALTVEALCREYIAQMEAGLILNRKGLPKKASTVYCDRGRIEHQIIPLLGKLLVRDVSLGDCQRFMFDLQKGKAKGTNFKAKLRGRIIIRGGSGTASRCVGLLGEILQYAVRSSYITSNPVRGIQRPADKKRTERLDPAGYRDFYLKIEAGKTNGAHWQATGIAVLVALTGMRKSEAVKLKLLEIDYKGRCLRLSDTKTGASIRPLGEGAIRLLKLLEPMARDGYVFPVTDRGIALGHAGKPYAGLEKQWKRMVGLFPSPHTLRHSFGSVANDLGYTLPTVSALLGHSVQGVTAGYIHHLDSALLAAADKVSNAIWEMMTLERWKPRLFRFAPRVGTLAKPLHFHRIFAQLVPIPAK